MVRSESVILSIFGAIIVIVIGTGMGIALVSSLRPQGITDTVVPVSNLLVFLILSGLLGLLASELAGPSGGEAGRPGSHCDRVATSFELPSHRTVQELADQVRMTVVPGILLDHVYIDPPE